MCGVDLIFLLNLLFGMFFVISLSSEVISLIVLAAVGGFCFVCDLTSDTWYKSQIIFIRVFPSGPFKLSCL